MHITITGNLGSGKSTVAGHLSKKLGYEIYSTGEIQRNAAEKMGITTLELNQRMMTDASFDYVIDDTVTRVSLERDSIIFDSRMAWHFAHDAFSVFIKVDADEAAKRVKNADRGAVESFASVEEAKASIEERGRLEKERFERIYGVDYTDKDNHDLVVDSTNISAEEVAGIVYDAYTAYVTANAPANKTVHTDMAPAAIGPYCQARKIGGLVFTSGQIPINPRTGSIDAETVAEQTRQVCINLAVVLGAADTTISKTVKTTCYLTDMANFAEFNEVYSMYFKTKPARSCVAVKALPKGALVEVEVIAEA